MVVPRKTAEIQSHCFHQTAMPVFEAMNVPSVWIESFAMAL